MSTGAFVDYTKTAGATVGLRVKFQGHTSHHYVTVAYLGNDPSLETFQAVDELRIAASAMRPIVVLPEQRDFFGPAVAIPLIVVCFENAATKELFDRFHARWGVCAPWMPEKRGAPIYHIAFKDSEPMQWPATGLACTDLVVMCLGSSDPSYMVTL